MLTKADANLIRDIFDESLKQKKLATKEDLSKIEKKFDKLFNFLDKDYLRVKQNVREIQSHLRISISDF